MNLYLQDDEAVRAVIVAHDPALVTETQKGLVGQPKETTYDFVKAREQESANAYLSSFSGAQFASGEVTGEGLERHLYGSHADYLHARARSMLAPTSELNLGQTNGHVYEVDRETDVVAVNDRAATARRLQARNVDLNADRMVKTAGQVSVSLTRETKRLVRLGGPAMREELEATASDAIPAMLGRVNDKLALGSGH